MKRDDVCDGGGLSRSVAKRESTVALISDPQVILTRRVVSISTISRPFIPSLIHSTSSDRTWA